MLNTFDNASRSESRRVERERSIRAMQAAVSSARSLPVFVDEDLDDGELIEDNLWDSDSIHRVSSPLSDDASADGVDEAEMENFFSGIRGSSTSSGRFRGWGATDDDNIGGGGGGGWGSSASTRSLGFSGASSSIRSLGTNAAAGIYGSGYHQSPRRSPRAGPGAKLLRGLVPTFGPNRTFESRREKSHRMNIAPARSADENGSPDDYSHSHSIGLSDVPIFSYVSRKGKHRRNDQWGKGDGGRSRRHNGRDSLWSYSQRDQDERMGDRLRSALFWLCTLLGSVALIGGCAAGIRALVGRHHEAHDISQPPPISPAAPVAPPALPPAAPADHTSEPYHAEHGDGGTVERPQSPEETPGTETPPGASQKDPLDRNHDDVVQFYARRIIDAGVTAPDVLGLSEDGMPVVPSLSIDELATPQRVALEWIALRDPMELDPDDEFLLQRYALAVFWFSTHEELLEMWREEALGVGLEHAAVPLREEEGKEWKESGGWMSNRGICSWHGVSCRPRAKSDGSADVSDVATAGFSSGAEGGPSIREETHVAEGVYDNNGEVKSLLLGSNNIRGFIPVEVFASLTEMEKMTLSHNSLKGPLSTQIGRMRRLRQLDLTDNELSGTIPVEIRDLEALTDLELSDNMLSGKIPGEALAYLGETLVELSLFANDLTSTLPTELGKMRAVQSLYLDSNKLIGPVPKELQNCVELKDLRLRDNALSGGIPEQLGRLSKLEVLYLDSNELTGPLTNSLGGLSSLQHLTLFDNSLKGGLPEAWSNLTQLSHLYLDGNGGLTGTLPSSWCSSFGRLRHLYLSDNLIRGPIPTEVGILKSLEKLHLRKNGLEGSIPTQLGRLSRLTELTLDGNALTGAVPEEVCRLRDEGEIALEKLTVTCGKAGEGAVQCDCCTDCL